MKSFFSWVEGYGSYNGADAVQNAILNLSYIGNYYANMSVPVKLTQDVQVLWQKYGHSDLQDTIARLSRELGYVQHWIAQEAVKRKPDYQNPELKESLRNFRFYLDQIEKYIKQNG